MTALNKALIFYSYRADTAETHILNLIVWLAELHTTVEITTSPSFSCECWETGKEWESEMVMWTSGWTLIKLIILNPQVILSLPYQWK